MTLRQAIPEYNGFLKPWTSDIAREWGNDKPIAEIARYLQPTIKDFFSNHRNGPDYYNLTTLNNAVRYYLKREGLFTAQDTNKLKKDRLDRILILIQKGQSYTEIAAEFGLTKQRVGQLANSAIAVQRKREKAQRTIKEIDKFVAKYSINKGRPLDIGGPRDIWIEQDPWEDL